MSLLKARVTETDTALFRYNLSRRVNDVQTYPLPSPQGATILLYGHENGVTIAWRGGRRFKPQQKKPEPEKKQNGSSEDVVMLIDSDDEQPPAKTQQAKDFKDAPQFEDECEETLYPEIVQTLELTLGTAVLHVAVISAAPQIGHNDESASTSLLSKRMAFAVSCVTGDVYVITAPLTPPSLESKAREELRQGLLNGQAGSGAWGETLVLLSGQRRHSDGLAMSLVKQDSESKPVRAVVASCTRQASGHLILWDVPLDPAAKPERPIDPFQVEYLPQPLTRISFNPTHTSQLLAIAPYQAARVYDYATSPLPPDPEAVGSFPSQGSWLLSLYQPFARPTASRRPILDAAWISRGRAIFVLLADGAWGIWDIDGVSPSTAGASMSNKLKSGVQGAALTAFSISGYVEGTGSLRSVAAQQKEHQAGDFAPMTPHTRRQATASLSTTTGPDRLVAVRGGVSVTILPAKGKSLQDESLALWIGSSEHVCVIPAVSRFWDSQLRKGSGGGVNLFSGALPTRMVKLSDLSTGLLGERCCGVNLMAAPSSSGVRSEDAGGLPVDILVQGETRLIIARHGEEGHGGKLGYLGNGRRRRLFSKDARSDAIIVHGKSDRVSSLSFNLSTAKPGTLRRKISQGIQDDAKTTPEGGLEDATQRPSQPRVGLDFMNTLSAAADVGTDVSARNVEAEMLDIMEIDQALDYMEDSRGVGRKKVLFEGD